MSSVDVKELDEAVKMLNSVNLAGIDNVPPEMEWAKQTVLQALAAARERFGEVEAESPAQQTGE